MKNELKWKIPEYPQYERGKLWYLIASVLGIVLLAFSVISGNFLFAVIVILAILISLASTWRKPETIEFKLSDEGAKVGELFYPWDKFQSYWIVKEDDNDKNYNLGLDLKNILKVDIYVPIKDHEPKKVEEFVLKHLKKNKERKDEPFSYFIGRKLKI